MLQCGAAFVNRSSTIVRKSQRRQHSHQNVLVRCISVMREPEPAVIVCSSEPQDPSGKCMPEPTLKFSVTCPDCALESVSEIPIAVIANRLLTGTSLRLYSY